MTVEQNKKEETVQPLPVLVPTVAENVLPSTEGKSVVIPQEQKTEKSLGGRPTDYTDELASKICERIASGESVRTIVKDEKMPASSTIYRWLLQEDKKEFWEQYEKARNIQAELMFEELLEIADDGSNDWMERELEGGQIIEIVDHEHISRSRLRIDTRKWFLSKVLPKKFSDKIDVTTNGKDLPVPILGGLAKTEDGKK